MAPSVGEVTQKLFCCVCEEGLESVSSLHYHQMCYHTTEELSLALLTLKGHKLLAQDLEEAPDSEDAVLCTGLAKYPHFLLDKNCDIVGSDSESTATAESSKLQGAISTLDGENITVPRVKICHRTVASGEESLSTHSALSEDSNVTPLRSGREQNTKLVVRKRRNDPKGTAFFKKYSNHNVRKKQSVASSESILTKYLDQNVENLILSCHSDDIKTVSSKDENSSGTDTDGTLKRPKSELSSNVSSASQTKDKSCEAFSAIFIKSDIEPSVVGSVVSENVTSDIECTKQTVNQCSGSPKTEGQSPIHKLSSCSSPSSVGSLPSPDNSPHPEHYIKAIISRLPNIIIPDSDQNSNIKSQGRRTSRKKQRTPRKCVNDKYVLPSPLSKRHRSSVLYDYSNKQCNSVQFQDFFVPNVKLGSGIDAECGTSPLGISEKEVQTAVLTPSDDDSGIQVDERDKKCKQSLVDEYISKETQTGLLSITTRRLAAYRKQSSRKCQNERPDGKKLNSNCSASITPHSKVCVTVAAAGNSNVRNSSSPSAQLKKNTSLSGSDVLDNSELTRNETEGKMKGWSKSLMKIYPRGMTERRFFCEPCGKGYKKKSHLERHVRVHTGERPFQCSHCEKRFAVRSILKQHVRTHTGEKPYCCTVCQQRFPQKSGLMTHTMLHTGKPFKCDSCEKAFVSNHKLLQHVKSHGGPHKYICSTCSTEFFTEGALLQHKQTHNRKSPYLCMICGKGFHQEKYLKFHLDQHLQKFSSIDSPT